MPEQLRKFAELLKEKAAALEAEKTVKAAQLVQAAVGLEFLRKKLGR
jgi:hypothetical protein